MTSNPPEALPSVRLIEAQAAKLADDLARGRLWEGEFAKGLQTIRAALEDAEQYARTL